MTLVLTACAAPIRPDKAGAERLNTARVVAVRLGLSENVSYGFASVGLGGGVRGFSAAERSGWGANQALLEMIKTTLSGSGRQVVVAEGSALPSLKPTEEESREVALSAISRGMAVRTGGSVNKDGTNNMSTADAETAQTVADINLIVAPLGLDPRGMAASPALSLLVGNPMGDRFLGARSGYLIHQPVLFGQGGSLSCVIGYNLAVTDAHSHTVLFATGDRIVRAALPADVPAVPYRDLEKSQKAAVGRICVAVARNSLAEDLKLTGLTAPIAPDH